MLRAFPVLYGGSYKLLIETIFKGHENNLWYEFLETLVNDEDVPKVLRRKIWALATMDIVAPGLEHSAICVLIAQEFAASDCCENLVTRWQKIVVSCWQYVPNCPLKTELDLSEA